MITLSLSHEARKIYDDAWKANEKMLAPGGKLEDIKDWGGKRMGNILRVGGALHVSKYPGSYVKHEIDVDTIRSAVAIGDYLIPHAKVAYGLASENHDLQNAKRVLEWIRSNGLAEFTFNDCHRRFKSSMSTAQEISKVLKLLEERNYVREMKQLDKGVGRPSRFFQVNPMFLEGR